MGGYRGGPPPLKNTILGRSRAPRLPSRRIPEKSAGFPHGGWSSRGKFPTFFRKSAIAWSGKVKPSQNRVLEGGYITPCSRARRKKHFSIFFWFRPMGDPFWDPFLDPFLTPFGTRFGPILDPFWTILDPFWTILVTLGDYRGHK